MSREYLVGNSADSWDFAIACDHAEDGDTIRLEPHFSYEDECLTIDKNLEFIGNITREDNTIHFSNTISAKVVVQGGVTVKFSNIYFQIDAENNNFYVDNSKVELNYVTLENLCPSSEYPIFYATNKSSLYAERLWINDAPESTISFKNSSATIKNSHIDGTCIATDSTVELENVRLKKPGRNVLNSKNASVTLRDCTIAGGNNEQDYPALITFSSNISLDNCSIEQADYGTCLYIADNSYLVLNGSQLTSLGMRGSRGIIRRCSIRESLSLKDTSYLVNDDQVEFLGESSDRVEIYLEKNSAFISGQLSFLQADSAVIRLRESSHLKAEKIDADVQLDISEDSCLINRQHLYEAPSADSQERPQLSAADNAGSMEKLDSLVGLEQVKKEINKMIGMVDFNNLRVQQGLEPEKISLHSVFMGNPGTGKTMVARLIGEVLYHSGVLPGKEFIFVEAAESDLISSSVGGTVEQTQKILDQAKGGILFIDEAYTLNKKGANVNYGQEAINTILKYMEDHREEIMIIFAGYTKEMEEFLRTNPGLESRVPNKFIFDDYTSDEIIEMGLKFLRVKKYTLEDEAYYQRTVKNAYAGSLDKSNGRWIRNFNEKMIKALANRVYTEKSTDVTKIKNSDIDDVLKIGQYESSSKKERDYLADLENMVGIAAVKEKTKEFIALAELNKKRMEQGQNASEFTLHSKFLGNPGTGKTTVARIIGNILYQKGIIRQNKFIEVSRSDLIAGYVGQTALKTREVLQSALGGVLFIDEAYSLNSSDFGMECVDEILKFMEDHRQDMVIIFAGYTEEMDEFFQMNPGLSSRVPNTFVFKDYSDDQIVQIGLLILKKYGYIVDEEQ